MRSIPNIWKWWISMTFGFMFLITMLPMKVFAVNGNYTPIDNLNVSVNDATTANYSNDTLTVTSKGSGGIYGIGASTKTTTITIQYTGENKATINFDWVATANQLTIDEAVVTATSGTFGKVMSSGESVKIVITTGKNNTENELIMSNFKTVEIASTSKVIFSYNSSIGSVSVAGTNMSNGGSTDISSEGAMLVASPVSGAEFVGWVDSTTHKILSKEKEYTFVPTTDCTVIAAFASPSTDAWFSVDGLYLFTDLNKAAQTGSTVVLTADGTLSNGTYTIPSGVTLLVPYSDDSTTYNTLGSPQIEKTADTSTDSNFVKMYNFRTLTIAAHAEIECNGNIQVDAKQFAAANQYTGHVCGPYGQLILENQSSLNLRDGSSLRAYGYVTGNGNIQVDSGAAVHELFQIADWRGGSVTFDIYKDLMNDSFVISQYYVQNIEATMTIKHGGSLTAHLAFAYRGLGISSVENEINIVGTNALFQLEENAFITRSFNSGRIKYQTCGAVKIGSIVVEVKNSIKTENLNSSNYILNLPSNMTIRIAEGTLTLPYSVKALPGTLLQIDEGATFVMNNNADLILYDYDDWFEKHYTYVGNYYAPRSSPTMVMPKPETGASLIVNGTLVVENGSGIYSTNMKNSNPGNNALKVNTNGIVQIVGTPQSPRSEIKESVDNSTTLSLVNVTPLQAPLAGIATSNTDYTNSMAYNSTYKGLADNYWYQYVIKAVAKDEAGEPVAAKVTGVSAPTLENVDVSSEQTVGYIANSTTANGVFKFKVETPQDYELVNVKVGETELKDDENGVYSLTDISQDTTISINFKKKVTYSVRITWNQTEFAKYTVTEETYTWNPLNLFYYKSKATGSWNDTKSVMSITLDNSQSSGGFSATFDYDSKISTTPTWTGLTNNKLSIAARGTEEVTLTHAPSDMADTPQTQENGSELTLGTITITLNKE